MRLGASLFLLAVGAILTFAVTEDVQGVNLGAVGVILMVVGVLSLLINVVWTRTRRRTDVIQQGPGGAIGTTYLEPHDTVDSSSPY
jgi:Flp pilus assembly protein TadB